jgi:hypothetical protein
MQKQTGLILRPLGSTQSARHHIDTQTFSDTKHMCNQKVRRTCTVPTACPPRQHVGQRWLTQLRTVPSFLRCLWECVHALQGPAQPQTWRLRICACICFCVRVYACVWTHAHPYRRVTTSLRLPQHWLHEAYKFYNTKTKGDALRQLASESVGC